ncbi:MAG: leucine-rich repeat domain-containing protein, partial [Bacteroidaceae bacterium]|nr:leucine-rich repeat domain-containing protein [Bacteroidaceae bacterium]
DLTVTPDTDYFLGADNNVVGFYKWDGTTLKANRAYLAAGSLTPVKGFAINFDDADGIHAVEKGDLKADNGIYNLAGQRVSKAQKGIFIVHGKKIVK